MFNPTEYYSVKNFFLWFLHVERRKRIHLKEFNGFLCSIQGKGVHEGRVWFEFPVVSKGTALQKGNLCGQMCAEGTWRVRKETSTGVGGGG